MIEFNGIDLVVEQRVDAAEIRRSVAAAMFKKIERTQVIDDLANYPERGTADVVCVTTPTAGDFAELLSIQCKPTQLPYESVIELVQRIASGLRTALLAPDDGPDPYAMWLLRPERPPVRVSLDAEALEEDRYVLPGLRDRLV